MKCKISYLAIIFIIFVFNSSILRSQEFELRNEIITKINATIVIDPSSQKLFNYKLYNFQESKQKIWKFMIIIKSNQKSMTHKFKVPNWWGPDISEDSPYSISWSAPEKFKIVPGDSLSGFSFSVDSSLLPCITEFYVEGYAPPPYYEGYAEEDFIHGYHDLTPYGPGIVGKTIGPVEPPGIVNPISFVENLISYKHEAYELGWIDNQGILNSLDSKLNNVKTQLENEKINQAINLLNAFLSEVEAQNKKHLTSEAYALLKFNTEYLIEQLLNE